MTAAALRTQVQDSLGSRWDVSFTLREKKTPDVVPTGVNGIEIPRGTLTEIHGPASSGRTSVLTGALAMATRKPEFCAVIDAGDSFDPRSAEDAGVVLPHLLWVRCGGSAEYALKAADLVIQAGGFGIVVLDLAGISARDARRISLASWFRLRHAVEKTPTALVVVEEEVNARSCSLMKIGSSREGIRMRGRLMRGLSASVNRMAFTLKPVFFQ
jgi:recombination protein RecA